MTKPSLSAVRDLHPSKPSRCSRCQHAEFVHAYAGPCLFHDCECPFFIPEAEPDVEEGRAESRPPGVAARTSRSATRVREAVQPIPPELAVRPIVFVAVQPILSP
jgi:hypothetical protein